jgi:hypothetical protein
LYICVNFFHRHTLRSPLPLPRPGVTVPADLRLPRSLDSTLRSSVLRDGSGERPLLGGEMVTVTVMGERLVTVVVTNSRFYILEVRRTAPASALDDDAARDAVLPTNSTIHVEVIATHRLSDLRRVVTGLGYQSLRLEFTPTTSGTVAMPGLAGMVLAPESPHSPSPAGNNSRSKRSQNSSDALPPMYPYLFLLRDRVHLTRFLACLIEQVEWFLQVLQALHFLKKNCFVFCAMMKRKKKKKKNSTPMHSQ